MQKDFIFLHAIYFQLQILEVFSLIHLGDMLSYLWVGRENRCILDKEGLPYLEHFSTFLLLSPQNVTILDLTIFISSHEHLTSVLIV